MAWFTSVNIDYLDRAAILARSMKEHHPDWVSYLLLVDHKLESEIECLLDNFDYVLYPDEVVMEDFSTWHKVRDRDIASISVSTWLQQHSVIEACTAIKPFGMEYISKKHEYVFYLDPDLAIFSSLEPLHTSLVAGGSLILTPHQLEPETEWQSIVDNEIGSLQTGIYNFGFLGLNSNHSQGIRFLNYWKERLKYFSTDDALLGLFTDQKWGNFATIFFQDVVICNHPGANVASWNLSQRIFSVDQAGNFLVNKQPLIFYHFSKANGAGLTMSQKGSHDCPLVADIWRWYLEQLEFFAPFVPRVRWKYA